MRNLKGNARKTRITWNWFSSHNNVSQEELNGHLYLCLFKSTGEMGWGEEVLREERENEEVSERRKPISLLALSLL